jgi:predicted fused transcriptional regulator/phosphomethylpyrimidine kinase
MRGRIEVPSDPAFGASKHVSTVILAARAVDPSIRGAINLVTDNALFSAARDRGIDPLQFDADYDNRGQRLRERFQARGEVPRVVYHEGAFGIEPITYVLDETAEDGARLAVDLVADANLQ